MSERSKAMQGVVESLALIAKFGAGMMAVVWLKWTPTTEGGIVVYAGLTLALIVIGVVLHNYEDESETSAQEGGGSVNNEPKAQGK
jgi:hypothetical protein